MTLVYLGVARYKIVSKPSPIHTPWTTTYTYDAASNLTRTEFPNDTVEIRDYDDLNRLTALKTVHIDPDTGTETVLSGFEYTLNDVGHRLSVTEFDGRVVNYTYDDLYRLTEENINNGDRTITYTYDNVGNRLTRNDSAEGLTTYTYDDNDRLLTEILTSEDGTTVHTITHSYDDNGNLISRVQETDGTTETTTYTWNDDDRLVAVETPEGNSITYEYDDQGIRVSATVDGETTEFLVDKNRPYAQVLEEFSSDQLQTFYVYGHDLISQTRNTEQDFYQVDGLGSTRALADEEGNVTDTYDYEAFGELIDSTGESENSYRFTGEQFDEDLGDYYLRDRFYDQQTGRFLRRDVYEGDRNHPISLHKYLYANDNPITFTDPSGFVSISEATAIGSIIGSLSGISIGGYIGYIKNDRKLGWPVFAYGLVGGLAGLTLGAQLGSLVGYFSSTGVGLGSGGALGTISKMTPKLVQQMGRIISNGSLIRRADGSLKGLTAISFAAGVVSGGIAGTFTPDEFTDEVGVGALATYGGGNALIIGYRWFQQTVLSTRPSVPGGVELATSYIAGFNLGYFSATTIRDSIEEN